MRQFASVCANNETVKISQILWRWVPTFLAFPLSGLLAQLALGPIKSFWAAAVSGAMVGVTLGLAQWWALKPLKVSFAWAWATGVSMMVASVLAGLATQFATDIYSLTIWGVMAGAIVGLGQIATQRRGWMKSLIWSASVSLTWGLAWFISANVIVDAESSYAIFGSTGAIAATILLSVAINPVLSSKG